MVYYMNTDTARTLLLVSMIFFIINILMTVGMIFMMYSFFPVLLSIIGPSVDPATLALLSTMQLVLPFVLGAFAILDVIYLILVFLWREDPATHKTGLLVIGILNLIITFSIQGILTLLAGIIAKSK